jgi:hypothetical protein
LLVNRLEAVGQRLNEIAAQNRRVRDHNRTISEADARIRGLTEEYRGINGRVVPFPDLPLALHPALPEPLSGLFYVPEARTDVAAKAHVAGYRSELRLANHIVEQNLGTVLQYGHRVVEHGADIISIDMTTGRVTLWDSKYRELRAASAHSATFTEADRRHAAADAAVAFLEAGGGSLSLRMREKAISDLKARNFDAVTAHTNGGDFTSRRIEYTADVETFRN